MADQKSCTVKPQAANIISSIDIVRNAEAQLNMIGQTKLAKKMERDIRHEYGHKTVDMAERSDKVAAIVNKTTGTSVGSSIASAALQTVISCGVSTRKH